MSLLFATLAVGLVFAVLALGVYLSFRVYQIPDITADGSFPLGAAITARLAHGDALAKAVAIASDFVGRGIASAPGFGDVGPLNHWA